jgi:hypothetical protein
LGKIEEEPQQRGDGLALQGVSDDEFEDLDALDLM